MNKKVIINTIDKEKIILLYTTKHKTIMEIKEIMNLGRYKIEEVLKENNLTHNTNENTKNKNHILNMIHHLKYDVSYEWVSLFDDINKLKFLNKTIVYARVFFDNTNDNYIKFIEKFYNDYDFNRLYSKWKETSNKWIKPSLDHIIPISKGGKGTLENLQYITWFENKMKFNIDNNIWLNMKFGINYYFSYLTDDVNVITDNINKNLGIHSNIKHKKEATYNKNIRNMQTHLKYKVNMEWLKSFDNIKKLQFLNNSITKMRDRQGFDDERYISFIEKFYYDVNFNYLYNKWLNTNDVWIKPSLDHIIPVTKKGTNELNNLRFISWFENKAKYDMTQDEWNIIKNNIYEYF